MRKLLTCRTKNPQSQSRTSTTARIRNMNDLLSSSGWSRRARMLQVIGAGTLWIRCSVREDCFEADSSFAVYPPPSLYPARKILVFNGLQGVGARKLLIANGLC